jgi:hypothetical protein
MGLLDIITGRHKLKTPAPDRLFAMSTAYVTFQTALEITSRGQAAIVFQALATADFQSIVKDMTEVLRATSSDAGGQVRAQDDDYGFRWMVISDPEFDDLVVGLNSVSSALMDGGYGDRILCAVFAFADSGGKPLYFIYNYKRGTFYPFVPAGGPQERDNEAELRLKAQAGGELPIESDLARWFPLWGIPI